MDNSSLLEKELASEQDKLKFVKSNKPKDAHTYSLKLDLPVVNMFGTVNSPEGQTSPRSFAGGMISIVEDYEHTHNHEPTSPKNIYEYVLTSHGMCAYHPHQEPSPGQL
mmetsp:Transcript_6604/g.8384  ORF Transcript_6604/g.8384 Transcript_6604/m.8384 type:complete len:109 (-) Transcript_6604:343-669(-)